MPNLQTSLATRIHPPSELTNNKWSAEDFDSRRIFSIPEVVVALLIYCITPQKKEKIITEISTFYKLSPQKIDLLILSLIEKKLIFLKDESQISADKNKLNSELFLEQYPTWKKYNWDSAAEYHFFTYDYPFLNYAEGAEGWHIANQRMNEYSAKYSDTNRIKVYSEEHKRLNVPLPFNDHSFGAKQFYAEENNLKLISIITAYGFAKTAEAPIRWEGVPLIRRTSPSGGSRHPTEGYLIVLDVEGIDKGLYHIQSDPFCFVKLKEQEKIDNPAIFPEFYINDLNNQPIAIIVLTSVFERNMFRYREPRTFRTIHMDAGHILGTMELISNNIGIKSQISHQIDEKLIEQLIGIDGLSEGVITSMAIFNASGGN
jgi:SagB-type dehydrogenase family enzyme